ncbi:hypothetical protein BS50DRAFT_593975 [Corynespora cassiicola Philippines]|uniref:Uncharacterized protein n=1 Tax=Corynespora cassiicola Philippines TaxID=1448308 RepID=A0A2T2N453_CORCC|nr:hypothetical protein BS50DRAFT_593975 [Corynespora cassiicola Philippines]
MTQPNPFTSGPSQALPGFHASFTQPILLPNLILDITNLVEQLSNDTGGASDRSHQDSTRQHWQKLVAMLGTLFTDPKTKESLITSWTNKGSLILPQGRKFTPEDKQGVQASLLFLEVILAIIGSDIVGRIEGTLPEPLQSNSIYLWNRIRDCLVGFITDHDGFDHAQRELREILGHQRLRIPVSSMLNNS